MAINLPSNIYSTGAVVLNSQPSVNLYAQILAKKQAREEALDQYEANRINRINETGLRDQDREGLDKRITDLKLYFNAHKDRIRRGNTPEAYNYEKMFRDNLGYISESKTRTALAQAGDKFRNENFKTKNQLPDEYWNDMKAHELPIDYEGVDPETGQPIKSKALDLNKYLSMQAPAYDTKKVLGVFADIEKNKQKRMSLHDIPTDKYSQIPVTEEYFSDKDKGAIAERAKALYATDWSVMNRIDKMIENPATRGQLESVFKNEFGTTTKDNSDYAVADIMQQLQPNKITEGKPIPKFKERKELSFEYSKKLIDRNKAAGTVPPNTGYISDNVADQAGEVKEIPGVGNRVVIYAKKVDPDRLATIIGQDISKKQIGVEPLIEPGTNLEYYIQDPVTGDWTGKGNQVISREAAKDRYVNKFSPSTFKAKSNTKAVEGANKKPQTGYTQITETNKGKIGVKNGKWYYVDTGKPVE
jgi:hypothetical protein